MNAKPSSMSVNGSHKLVNSVDQIIQFELRPKITAESKSRSSKEIVIWLPLLSLYNTIFSDCDESDDWNAFVTHYSSEKPSP